MKTSEAIKKLNSLFEENTPSTPLTKEESVNLMNILLSDQRIFNTPISELSEENKENFKEIINSFPAQLLIKRLKVYSTLQLTIGSLLLLIQHISLPGHLVMYAYYLNMKLPKETIITAEEFVNVFPMGYFSEKQLNDIWNGQKIDEENRFELYGTDNLIDIVELWKK